MRSIAAPVETQHRRIRSLVARNAHSLGGDRGPDEAARVLSRAKVAAEFDDRIERVAARKFGVVRAAEFMAARERARTDPEFGCVYFWGTVPLQWQLDEIFAPFLAGRRIDIGRLSNAGGKTVSFTLLYLLSGICRLRAAPMWGLYRMIHFGPKESHALETKVKVDELVRGRAREQWDDDAGEFRPALGRYFLQAVKFGPHQGYEFFADRVKGKPEQDFVASTLAFMPTAGRGESGDGTDPMVMGLDEGRHERYLTHIVYRIWVPRTLRTPGAFIYIPYTSLEASPELEAIKAQAEADQRGHFHTFDRELNEETNPHLRKADIQAVSEILPADVWDQVKSGKASQPAGAYFSLAAIKAAFPRPPAVPGFDWLGDMDGQPICPCSSCTKRGAQGIPDLRSRILERCPKCQARTDGHPDEHMLVGQLDPASSAPDADEIVFKVWDLDPPARAEKPRLMCETVYTEALAPGTRIQHVATHFNAVAAVIAGPMGWDRKSALGHNFEDLILEPDPDIEATGLQWDTESEKDRALAFTKALMDQELWASASWDLKTSTQLQMYVRRDRKIAQDYVMCEVMLGMLAQPYLPIALAPDGKTLIDTRPPLGEGEEGDRYGALSGYEWYGGQSDDLYASSAVTHGR